MHHNAFGGWAPPEPAGGAYSAPPDPLVEFGGGEESGKWVCERGREGKGEEIRKWQDRQCLKCVDANAD